jgi:uncharacterized protein (DUF952 family)
VAIYHIAFRCDWEKAIEHGEYRISTRGRTLDEQGFIHASDAHQVALVANFLYRPDEELIVLVIEPERLHAQVRYEYVPDSADPFPHIYGPINADAVVATQALEFDADGAFSFTGSQ